MDIKLKKQLGILTLVVVGMFGFGYALVPLYDVICDITGLNGKGRNISERSMASVSDIDQSRTVTVEFITTLNQHMPWEFGVEQHKITVHPGELKEVTFFARNNTDQDMIGQAVPSVSPWSATNYLKKTECFCFSQQPFAAGERRQLPLVFMIDPALPDHVDTLTLSYTFFDATQLASGQKQQTDL